MTTLFQHECAFQGNGASEGVAQKSELLSGGEALLDVLQNQTVFRCSEMAQQLHNSDICQRVGYARP